MKKVILFAIPIPILAACGDSNQKENTFESKVTLEVRKSTARFGDHIVQK